MNSSILLRQLRFFSSHYQNNEGAKELTLNSGNKLKKDGSPSLKFRFEEIITFLNELFHLNPNEISQLAQILSNARNFFTHYDETRAIPSVQELLAARVLHFMLLALVYRKISLEDSAIERAVSRFSYGTLLKDIQIVLQREAGDNMYE